jgi:hypothetical protein
MCFRKMGDTWISNILHFLDEDGVIPVDLPGPAFRLANHFGSIVKSVSSRQDRKKLNTGIKWRRRPGRKPCPREILALINERNDFAIIGIVQVAMTTALSPAGRELPLIIAPADNLALHQTRKSAAPFRKFRSRELFFPCAGEFIGIRFHHERQEVIR